MVFPNLSVMTDRVFIREVISLTDAHKLDTHLKEVEARLSTSPSLAHKMLAYHLRSAVVLPKIVALAFNHLQADMKKDLQHLYPGIERNLTSKDSLKLLEKVASKARAYPTLSSSLEESARYEMQTAVKNSDPYRALFHLHQLFPLLTPSQMSTEVTSLPKATQNVLYTQIFYADGGTPTTYPFGEEHFEKSPKSPTVAKALQQLAALYLN